MKESTLRKKKTKLIYTPSALPLILEALGYNNLGNKLIHISDGSYVYDDKQKKITVSDIVGFEKGKFYTQKPFSTIVKTRKVN